MTAELIFDGDGLKGVLLKDLFFFLIHNYFALNLFYLYSEKKPSHKKKLTSLWGYKKNKPKPFSQVGIVKINCVGIVGVGGIVTRVKDVCIRYI